MTSQKPVLNIANVLTVLRILMVPIFVAAFVADAEEYSWWRWAALAVFCIAVYTDLLDGDLARSRNIITDFGRIADPMADKVLIGSALVLLSSATELPWLVTFVILGRECVVTILRFLVIRRGIIAASRGGKIKTFFQIVAIFLYLLPWTPQGEFDLLNWGAGAVMMLAVILSLVTGFAYAAGAWRLARVKDRAHVYDAARDGDVPQFGEQIRTKSKLG